MYSRKPPVKKKKVKTITVKTNAIQMAPSCYFLNNQNGNIYLVWHAIYYDSDPTKTLIPCINCLHCMTNYHKLGDSEQPKSVISQFHNTTR